MAIQNFSVHRKRQRKSSKLNLPHERSSEFLLRYPLNVFEDNKAFK